MRIHNLVIDNVRGVEHLALTDVPDTGVILIHGDNEAGKSTILDALDAVLTAKHTSTAANIRALNPIGRDETPSVELGATVGPYTFTVHKSFAKGAKGKTELRITAPKREELTGEQAHNRLREILEEHVDEQLFGALFMRQGSFSDVIEAAGIPSFTRALEQTGTDAGADTLEDSGLMQKVQKEYEKFFSPKSGAEKQNLKEADAAVATAEEAVRESTARKAAYDDGVDEYARSEHEMRTIAAELPDAEKELAQRKAEAAAAREVAGKLAEAQEKAKRATTDHQRAKTDLDLRAALAERAEKAAAELAELEVLVEPAREKAEAEAERVAEKKAAHASAREALIAARTITTEQERARELALAYERIGEVEEQVGELDRVDKEIAAVLAATPTRPVTDDDVRAIENASQNVALQRRLREAAAARMELTASKPTTITVDGDEFEVGGSSQSLALHDGAQLTIGDVTLTYRAAPGTTDASHAVEDAEAELTSVLHTAGCESLEEARKLRDVHRDLAATLTTHRARRADILRGREADELRQELTRLRELAGVPAHESEAGDVAILSVEEADAALDAARTAEKDASEAAHVLEVELAQLAAQPDAAKLADIEARVDNHTSSRDAANADLITAREKISDADLAVAAEEAALAEKQALAEVEELTSQVEAVDPEQVESLREGTENRVANLTRRYDAARDRKLELGFRVTSAEGEAEILDKAKAALEAARVRRDRLRRQATAVKLLHGTLVEHRDAARAKYAEPFAQALQRYASRVFGPGTEFTLDESLQVTARTLDGTTVDVGQLSGGAKEQMALLTRFAIADMVAGNDAGAMPVVVDDALGATDPTRLELMNALFTQVGARSQVFVLTCFPQRFDRVATAKSASIQELKKRDSIG